MKTPACLLTRWLALPVALHAADAPPASLARDSGPAANLLQHPSFEEKAGDGVEGWMSRAWAGKEATRWSVAAPGRTGERRVSIASDRGHAAEDNTDLCQGRGQSAAPFADVRRCADQGPSRVWNVTVCLLTFAINVPGADVGAVRWAWSGASGEDLTLEPGIRQLPNKVSPVTRGPGKPRIAAITKVPEPAFKQMLRRQARDGRAVAALPQNHKLNTENRMDSSASRRL